MSSKIFRERRIGNSSPTKQIWIGVSLPKRMKQLSDICKDIVRIAKNQDDDHAIVEIGMIILDIKSKAYNEGLEDYYHAIIDKFGG